MLAIFHGQDSIKSRQAMFAYIDQQKDCEKIHLDSKSIDLSMLNLFLESSSLFNLPKLLIIDNYFSIHKTTQEKLTTLILKSQQNIVLWQDKKLSPTQIAPFKFAKIAEFKASDLINDCIFALKPGNLKLFSQKYQKMLLKEPFDLFFYLLKYKLRKDLQAKSLFSTSKLEKTYLQLIQLDYQNKTGQLAITKELALLRTLSNLLS